MTGVKIYDPNKSSREYRHVDPATGLIVPDAPKEPVK